MRYLNEGHRVRVLRDLHRIPNPRNAEEKKLWDSTRSNYYWSLELKIPTCCPPWAVPALYASEGETGVVERVWKDMGTLYVLVNIDGERKTLRRTSVEILD